MWQYERIYTTYFQGFRLKKSKKLSAKTIKQRVSKVMESLDEKDRHALIMFMNYGTTAHAAKMDDISVKKFESRLEVAVNHLITPSNVVAICGIKPFKHKGQSLTLYLDNRTTNALRKKSNIITVEDLRVWLSYGSRSLFRLPGCGRASIQQIVHLMYTLKPVEV